MFEPNAVETVVNEDYIVGIRIRKSEQVKSFRSNQIMLQVGDDCVVETQGGTGFGTVDRSRMVLPPDKASRPVQRVIRRATKEDYQTINHHIWLEKDARKFCEERIAFHRIPMRLTDVEYTFDARKAIFYFTADGRVDFRELVKDLNHQLRMKVELRQIGARDGGRKFACVGACGFQVCCGSFIDEFDPVSIRMAKDQNLSLNPDKITGVCGRLKCCLAFEHEGYKEAQSRMPKVGKYVETPDGEGKVTQVDLLQEEVTIQLGDGRKCRHKGCCVKKAKNPSRGREEEESSGNGR